MQKINLSTKRLCAVSMFLAIASTSHVYAADLFRVEADGISDTGSSIVDLLEDLTNFEGAFSALPLSTNYSASIDYGTATGSIMLDYNIAGTGLLQLRSARNTGFNQASFELQGDGSLDVSLNSALLYTVQNADANNNSVLDPSEFEDVIFDFIESDGASVYADYLAYINETTALGLTDGNPNAQTARLTDASFQRWGAGSHFAGLVPLSQGGASDQGLVVTGAIYGGVADLDDYDAYDGGAEVSLGYRAPGVGFVFSADANYQNIEGADVFKGGLEAAVPLGIYESTGFLEITPLLQLGAAASEDMANGGLFYGYGAAFNAGVAYEGYSFGAGVQYLVYEGLDAELGDYTFETEVDQASLTVGFTMATELTKGAQWQFGLQRVELMEAAVIDEWYAPSLGLYFGDTGTNFYVGYEGRMDLDGDYMVHGLTLRLAFSL